MRKSQLFVSVSTVIWAGLLGCGGSSPEATTPESAPAETTSTTTSEAPRGEPSATSEANPAPETPPSSASTTLDIPPYGASADRIMKAHFNDALLIRKAVIDGRPEEAANPATVIAVIQDLDKLPDGWRPFVLDMQQTARRVTDGSTPAVVAAAAADLGVACGSCHTKFGGPMPSSEPAPAPGNSVESRMAHHAWATERLWEALAVPSDAAWKTGAKALSTDPFPAEVLKEGGVNARSAAADFVKLVAKAPAKTTTADRAALYAELLVTCGTCHRAMLGED